MSDFTVDVEREEDGRWIGEVSELPGVLAYGASRDEAVARAKALAFRVLADRLEQLDRQQPNATELPREVRTPREATTSERPLDLNRATPDELTALPGVGPALALRIVQARETGGRVASVDDLRRVKGLTVTRLERLRPLLTVAE